MDLRAMVDYWQSSFYSQLYLRQKFSQQKKQIQKYQTSVIFEQGNVTFLNFNFLWRLAAEEEGDGGEGGDGEREKGGWEREGEGEKRERRRVSGTQLRAVERPQMLNRDKQPANSLHVCQRPGDLASGSILSRKVKSESRAYRLLDSRSATTHPP